MEFTGCSAGAPVRGMARTLCRKLGAYGLDDHGAASLTGSSASNGRCALSGPNGAGRRLAAPSEAARTWAGAAAHRRKAGSHPPAAPPAVEAGDVASGAAQRGGWRRFPPARAHLSRPLYPVVPLGLPYYTRAQSRQPRCSMSLVGGRPSLRAPSPPSALTGMPMPATDVLRPPCAAHDRRTARPAGRGRPPTATARGTTGPPDWLRCSLPGRGDGGRLSAGPPLYRHERCAQPHCQRRDRLQPVARRTVFAEHYQLQSVPSLTGRWR